jgi:hypothetical protein
MIFQLHGHTKWKYISTCFVLVWNTGLNERCGAYMITPKFRWRREQKYQGHVRELESKRVPQLYIFVTDLYSTSVLDLDTVGYFRELHEIRFKPRNT